MVIYTAIYILSVHFSVDYSVNDVKTLEPPGCYQSISIYLSLGDPLWKLPWRRHFYSWSDRR
jgi:hypothetical protein